METLSPEPMNLLRVDFREIYARHLCRHSQLGINVGHLAALFGVWFGVYGAIYCLMRSPWAPVAMAGAYLLCVAPSLPLRVTCMVAVFLAVLVLALLRIPLLPIWAFWAYLILIPLCYRFQNWNHKVYNLEKDMTLFKQKYAKGRVLFVLLLFYEVPLLINFLVFGRKDWATSAAQAQSA